MDDRQHALTVAWEWIRDADALLICAGAGMGVDSGLPDFRGPEGLWRHYPGLARAQLSFQEIASPWAFQHDAALAWGFYGHRLAMYRQAQPHRGFQQLLQWGGAKPHGCAVYTSNVDGQFQKAGFRSKPLTECHGSLHFMQCTQPCGEQVWSADDFVPEVDLATSRLSNSLPRCPRCGALARPNVLMFDDLKWVDHREREQRQAHDDWLQHPKNGLVLEIGAGDAISTVRSHSKSRLAQGWRMIRVNPASPLHASPNMLQVDMTAKAFFEAMAIFEA